MVNRLAVLLLLNPWLCASAAGQTAAKARTDTLGDPLPAGAIARLGTQRLKSSSDIETVVFSPNGKTILTGPDTRLWDAATGKQLHLLANRERYQTRQAAFSPDGRLLAVAAEMHPAQPLPVVVLWDLATGRELATLTEDDPADYKVAFAADSKKLITLDNAGTVRVYDVAERKVRTSQSMEKWPEVMFNCQLSPNGCVFVGEIGKRDNTFKRKDLPQYKPAGTFIAWDVATGKQLWRIDAKDKRIICVFSPDSQRLALSVRSEQDVQILIRDPVTGKECGRLDKTAFVALGFAPDGKTVAAINSQLTVALWDWTGKAAPRELSALPDEFIVAVAYSPDGKSLAIGTGRSLHLVDTATGKAVFKLDGHRASVTRVAFAEDGRSVISDCRRDLWFTSRPGDLLRWDIATWKLAACSSGSGLANKFGVDWLSPNHTLGTGSVHDGRLVLELPSGKNLAHIKGHAGHCEFSPTGSFLLILANNGRGPDSVFDVKTGQKLLTLPNGRMRYGVAFPEDEHMLACYGHDGVIHLVELPTGKTIGILGTPREDWNPDSRKANLAFAQDGKRLAAWDPDTCMVVVWDLVKRKPTLKLQDEAGRHWEVSLAWSPDGRILADNGVKDRKGIRLWETATGRLRCELNGHDDTIESLAFSPDGRLLASGSDDTTVLIWDVFNHGP